MYRFLERSTVVTPVANLNPLTQEVGNVKDDVELSGLSRMICCYANTQKPIKRRRFFSRSNVPALFHRSHFTLDTSDYRSCPIRVVVLGLLPWYWSDNDLP